MSYDYIINQVQLEHQARLDEPRLTPKPRKHREKRRPDVSIIIDALQQKQTKSKS